MAITNILFDHSDFNAKITMIPINISILITIYSPTMTQAAFSFLYLCFVYTFTKFKLSLPNLISPYFNNNGPR